jgi:hypothetical protein
MISRIKSVELVTIFFVIASLACGRAISFDNAIVTIDPSTTYQTITGWEANAQIGQTDFFNNNEYRRWQDSVLDQAVDLGINRLRVEVRSGAENPVDYFQQFLNGQITEDQFKMHRYEIINDNGDPNSINSGGFHFTELDFNMDVVAIPIKQRLEAAGESLQISVNYVDFGRSSFEHTPDEYAEFVLAVYRHLQSKYGLVPDFWEVILEPDTSTATWTARQVADCIVAAGNRLTSAGYRPAFIAPSTTSMAAAPAYFDAILSTSGAVRYLKEISYHRYGGVSDANLQAIASRAMANNVNTSMLEHIGADHATLYKDLSMGRNSAWQQFTLAYPTSDNGAQYFIVDRGNSQVRPGSRTRFLRQYFKFIRRGALRLGATSNNAAIEPLCFRNVNGTYVVVMKTSGSGAISIQGLPAGNYGIKYTTSSQYDIDLPDATVMTGQSLDTSIPQAGVITVYGKQGQPAPGNRAEIERCSIVRSSSGSFSLTVIGRNIRSGAAVTIEGVAPKKIKFKDETDQGVFSRLVLKKGICDRLPGTIVITNPGSPPSEGFPCSASCN